MSNNNGNVLSFTQKIIGHSPAACRKLIVCKSNYIQYSLNKIDWVVFFIFLVFKVILSENVCFERASPSWRIQKCLRTFHILVKVCKFFHKGFKSLFDWSM